MKTLLYTPLILFSFLITPNLLATDASLSLTASDGTGLELRKLEARVVLDGFLAFTELEIVFYNPEPRRREGHFQIILPDNAAISRFAMKIGESLQEGEVVEKQQARRAYEDFLHRRQDPALLETDSGNRFNARIFPIEPQSEKLLLLSYSQRLTADYVLPLKGLPRLKQLLIKVFYDSDQFNSRQPTQLGALSATVSKRDVLTVDKRDYQPTDDFKMPYQPSQADRLAMRSGSLVAAKIVPFPDTATTTSSQAVPLSLATLVVLLDSSASQAPFWADTVKTLATLLPRLKVETLMVYTFDQTLTQVGTATTATAQSALLQKLTGYPILGASRLDSLASSLKDLPLKSARVLLVSDLVITAGETSATVLAQQFKTIPWLNRLDVLLPSYHNDRPLANKLVTVGTATGMVASLPLSDVQLAQKLTSPVYADLPIKMPEALWSWPTTVGSLQTNEPVIIFAELAPPMATATSSSSAKETQTVNIQVADKTFAITPQNAHPLLLQREWVRARIDRLLELEDITTDKDLKSAYHHEVINLSVKDRVLSPYTSLLVLETEEDYRRFNIDRQALRDILTVSIDGLSVIKRTGLETPPPPPPVIEERQMPLTAAKTRPRPSNGESSTTASPPASAPSDNKPTVGATESTMAEDKAKGKESEDAKAPPKMEEKAERESKKTDLDGGSTATQNEGFVDEVPLMKGPAEETMAYPAPSPSAESLRSVSPPPPPESPSPVQADAAAPSDGRQLRDESIREAPKELPTESAQMGISESVPLPRAALESSDADAVVEQQPSTSPWIGRYAEFRGLLDKGDLKAAGNLVQPWRQTDLADLMALIALGEWYEKKGETAQAARAYGSLIDYFPARADIRRWAGERLLSLKTEPGLSIDTFKKAVEQRPDHPSSHYLLAIAYWEAKQYKEAIETLQTALQREFDPRFLQIKRILEETLAVMLTDLEKRGQLDAVGRLPSSAWEKVKDSQWRFVMMWETDTNDVDFHIYDKKHNHAFYSQPSLSTGGVLYADITTGYGPECFTIPNPKAAPYKIEANYYNMGPMGYGMGMVHILRYMPTQGIQSEFRPFVVMQNGATMELGEVK